MLQRDNVLFSNPDGSILDCLSPKVMGVPQKNPSLLKDRKRLKVDLNFWNF